MPRRGPFIGQCGVRPSEIFRFLRTKQLRRDAYDQR